MKRRSLTLVLSALALALPLSACARASSGGIRNGAPSPDPRVGLKAGLMNAQEASWNMRVLSETRPSEKFLGSTNSDLAFLGKYVIQGSYNGWQIWDITNPMKPTLATAYFCPASQSDVSVYKNLLFVSGEGTTGRIDCGAQGVPTAVSKDRLRGVRIFDITDITKPRNVGNVQTCRGSHTHTVLVDPKDPDNVYIYISGSAGVRPSEELPGCVNAAPDKDLNSALFRIEVIKVPVKNPGAAAIVSSPRIFNNLTEPLRHGDAPDDKKAVADAKARGEYIVDIEGESMIMSSRFTKPLLDSVVKARNGTGNPTKADSAALRTSLQGIVEKMFGIAGPVGSGPRPGPTQCHDITVYPAIGLAGGACEGYGLLLDIKDPANPKRIAAVSDSNFSYWHSATFNNDGTKILFSDEWGGGGGPKCRVTDPKEWGADALFTIENGKMVFQSYYKMPAPQTQFENCVAHNGSMIPIPGRDIMVQSWYQGGVSVFDFTDIKKPIEIAFFDRGPVDSTRMGSGGTWSVYWYNGVIVSSEISRGLDIFDLTPSSTVSRNEIDAAKTVQLEYLNTQGQPQYVWPPSFALARAYVDQLERSQGLSARRVVDVRKSLSAAEGLSGAARRDALTKLAGSFHTEFVDGKDPQRIKKLENALNALAR